jgi:multidrug efflux pump subunit AcrB
LQDIVDDEIVDPLKRVKGVAAATPRGGLERQIRIDIDRHKLAALSLSVEQLKLALASQNISTPGGSLKPVTRIICCAPLRNSPASKRSLKLLLLGVMVYL